MTIKLLLTASTVQLLSLSARSRAGCRGKAPSFNRADSSPSRQTRATPPTSRNLATDLPSSTRALRETMRFSPLSGLRRLPWGRIARPLNSAPPSSSGPNRAARNQSRNRGRKVASTRRRPVNRPLTRARSSKTAARSRAKLARISSARAWPSSPPMAIRPPTPASSNSVVLSSRDRATCPSSLALVRRRWVGSSVRSCPVSDSAIEPGLHGRQGLAGKAFEPGQHALQAGPDDEQPHHHHQRKADDEDVELGGSPGDHPETAVDDQQRGHHRQGHQQGTAEQPAAPDRQLIQAARGKPGLHRQDMQAFRQHRQHGQMAIQSQKQQRGQ